MPFTLAHPVAIFPFAYRWPRLPLSALVIGSMAPDFPYFLMVDNDYYHFGHSFRGVFEFCLPAGIVALLLFHGLVKLPLLSLLPPAHVSRLLRVARAFKIASLSDILLCVAAIVIGAISHVVVDSFTHVNGFAVRLLPLLAHPVPIYKALQYGGSLGGLWYLWYRYQKWCVTAPADPGAAQSLQRLLRPQLVVWFLALLFVLSIAVGIAMSAFTYDRLGGHESAKKIFADGLEGAMSAYALGLLVFSCVWQILASRRRGANS